MGALTLKPLAYKARSWELNNVEIINFLDSYCGQIAIQKRGNEIIRILPSRKDHYYWINDKIRFFFESLKKQRVSFPLLYLQSQHKFIKLNWQNSVLFLIYIKNNIDIIDQINIIEKFLQQKNFKVFKNLTINSNTRIGDLLSHYLLNEFFKNQNLVKYEFFPSNEGDIQNNFYNMHFLKQIKQAKYNILNNIDIINDYPRIWSIIKNAKVIMIGNKKNIKIQTVILNNSNQEIFKIEKFKSIIGFLKRDIIIYTEQEIKNNKYIQILLNKNPDILNKKWINTKNDNYNVSKNFLTWSFFKNPIEKALGINFNFLTHGIDKMKGYQIIFPITTFMEENSLRLNPYGIIQKGEPVNIRANNVRSLTQILFLIKSLFKNEETKNSAIDFKFLKDLLLLKYGKIAKNLSEKVDYIRKPKIKKNKIIMIHAKTEQELFKYSDVLSIKSKFLNKKNNY